MTTAKKTRKSARPRKTKKRETVKRKIVTIEEQVKSGALGFGLTLKQTLRAKGYSKAEIDRLLKK